MQPEDADRHVGPGRLDLADPAQGAVDLVLGVLPDGAGVVEDGVGLLDVVGQLVPLIPELADDQLAVEQVHLAAHGLDVELLAAGGTRIRHRADSRADAPRPAVDRVGERRFYQPGRPLTTVLRIPKALDLSKSLDSPRPLRRNPPSFIDAISPRAAPSLPRLSLDYYAERTPDPTSRIDHRPAPAGGAAGLRGARRAGAAGRRGARPDLRPAGRDLGLHRAQRPGGLPPGQQRQRPPGRRPGRGRFPGTPRRTSTGSG